MQQAIYLDIALFFPGLIAALISVISPASIPPAVAEIGNDVLFFSMLAAVIYSVISSLLGQEPNKIPVISQAVESRMPTVEMSVADDSSHETNENPRMTTMPIRKR